MAAKKDFVIEQGKTFQHVLRWEAPPFIYKPISAITKDAPVSITATGHGVLDGWRVAVVSVEGMTEINAELGSDNLPKEKSYFKATYIDANTIELNRVNSSQFSQYQSGGYLQYLTPVDLAGYAARMTLREKVGGAEIVSLTTENGGIIINNTTKTITIVITAAQAAAIAGKKGVYDLEMVVMDGPTEVVTGLLYGSFTVTKEVTTG